MRIAVTGPTGAIGSEMVRLALADGDEVIAIVRPGSNRSDNLPKHPKLTVVECDISDYASIRKKFSCDIFYHLAWAKTFGAERDDVGTQIDNIRYSVDAVELANSWGAKAFVGVGSQAEYGHSDVPLNGSLPVNPESGYGIAKYASGRLCSLRCQQLGLRFNWARVLSVYGEKDANHTLIMYLLKTLLNGDVPELTKCEQTWDYIYAEDCARAILCIGQKGKEGKTYCIGSGKPRRLREYVETLRDVIDPALELRFGVKEYYPHQAMMLCADISELTADTGFVPEYTFEEGIAKVVKYLRGKS